MENITLENYRCFGSPQQARLAPLTLLVGENSTGKSSFLAIIRAVWNAAFLDYVPDFREEPYDLGSFSDVAHNRGRRSGKTDSFEAGFAYKTSNGLKRMAPEELAVRVTFRNRGAFPFPVKRRFDFHGIWVEVESKENGSHQVDFGAPHYKWQHIEERSRNMVDTRLFPMRFLLREIVRSNGMERPGEPTGIDRDREAKDKVVTELDNLARFLLVQSRLDEPFASAPVRSRPRRTYEPTRFWQDPEGVFIPAYLADISHRDLKKWGGLKTALEKFGSEAGLFDEISIKSLGKTEGAPFQVQIRKSSGKLKGPRRNMIDVGYGVSQALPVLTQVLDPDAPPMFLLQQPEVHLHPSAQAALGSLFCSTAGLNRQFIVETHSDYLLDRVRMEIRDKKTELKPEDVSILFFEPGSLDVNIHSLRLDEQGNVLDEPPSYGRFFMDEVTRSIGI